eukprot:TRINITY_DN2898_c0_g1_i1.p1 TRINITY_DN2898_c0_g1~~TRINITY_DN2898_c0_g1_i1.p1  ORF type:complete len:176 (-),score=10.65 TRINITY_DN2898_c0_g1_i1:113-640(-)
MPDARNVYFGNLPTDCTEDQLASLVLPHAKIEKITIWIDRVSLVRNDFGLVRFSTEGDASNAIKMLHGTFIHGHDQALIVRLAKAPEEELADLVKPEKNASVVVSFSPPTLALSELSLYRMFAPMGGIHTVEVEESQLFGIVSFMKCVDAQRAVALSGTMVDAEHELKATPCTWK